MEDMISKAEDAFVKGTQILDAVFIANKVVEEVRKIKKEGLIFKIEFEKAYNHVDWGFQDYVLEHKGFGIGWRRWIEGCVESTNFL